MQEMYQVLRGQGKTVREALAGAMLYATERGLWNEAEKAANILRAFVEIEQQAEAPPPLTPSGW